MKTKAHTKGKYREEWKEFRKSLLPIILARDSVCQACGTDRNLTPDHILPIRLGGTNRPDNLQVLCLFHNIMKHKISTGKWDACGNA